MADVADPQVLAVFENYPSAVQKKMFRLRRLILESAERSGQTVEESLKWGEPSYRCQSGSPVRLGVRTEPHLTLCLFFNCQTLLVETFKEMYPYEIRYDGKRAILLPADHKLPEAVIKDCITMALEYHQRKHLPLLGA